MAFTLAAAWPAGSSIGAVVAGGHRLRTVGRAKSRRPVDARLGGAGAAPAAALVVVEVALAVVLTVGAGLLVRSFVALLDVDPGFKPDSLLTLQMNIPDTYDTPPKRLALLRHAFARLEALPGVQAVGGTTRLPLGSTT